MSLFLCADLILAWWHSTAASLLGVLGVARGEAQQLLLATLAVLLLLLLPNQIFS
jgi:hypothetical protein